MTPNVPTFERLEQSITLIARHAEYPGKREVVADRLEEIDGLWRQGHLTLEQRFRLYAILLSGATSHHALSASA